MAGPSPAKTTGALKATVEALIPHQALILLRHSFCLSGLCRL